MTGDKLIVGNVAQP